MKLLKIPGDSIRSVDLTGSCRIRIGFHRNPTDSGPDFVGQKIINRLLLAFNHTDSVKFIPFYSTVNSLSLENNESLHPEDFLELMKNVGSNYKFIISFYSYF